MANLRNIRQIGTPAETDKIYIEDNAYTKLHQDEWNDRCVFLLMGHTESEQQSYATFIEAAIPIVDIGFSHNTPIWNNHVWNNAFRETKRLCEELVIVGWALDIKGASPKITADLEAIQREQFGGVHQLLFLMDSLEQEEYFYICRNNHLKPKEGFYIYYDENVKVASQIIPFPKSNMEETVTIQAPTQDQVQKRKETAIARLPERDDAEEKYMRPRYREIMYANAKQTTKNTGRWISYYGIAMAIVLILAIIGTGWYQGKVDVQLIETAVETMGHSLQQIVLPH